MRSYDDLTGRDFGKWHVDKFVSNVKDIHYNCICECGYEKIISGSALRANRTKQCRKCCGVEKRLRGIVPVAIFNRFSDGAKRRDIDFSISIEYAEALFIAQELKCALSGLNIEFAKSCQDHSHGGSTASLDRIDSRYGYIEGNVQWVHKNVNKMKQNLEQSYFINMCKLIVDNNIDIISIDIKPSLEIRRTPSIRTKLTDENVKEIRLLHSNGIRVKDISERFNCTPGNISLIVNNHSRKN